MAIEKVKLKPISSVKKEVFVEKPKVALPTEVSKPSNEIGVYSLLVYGRKKIGKTSLVSNFPKTFCMMFEPGAKSLRIYQKPVGSWEEFLAYIDLLENTKHDFKTVCIDTGKIAYDYCLDYVCRINNFEHPTDEAYGKGWEKVRKELQTAFIRLMNLGIGVIVICHEKIADIMRKSSETYNRIIPDLAGQAGSFFAGVIDTIAYYHYVDEQRVLTIQGDEEIEAGTRCEENFRTVSGERIYNIPMGSSSSEAYKNLIAAFNNRQKDTGKEVLKKKKII